MTETPNTGTDGDFLFGARLVPAGREGNKVFARSLRPGEEDTGEVVHVGPGEQLIIRPGDLVISSEEIDSHSPKGLGGYAHVANTVWTWYRIVNEQVGFFQYVFALARRLDAAHASWGAAVEELDKAKNGAGLARRHGLFKALSEAEVAIIALHRAMDMLSGINGVYGLNLEIPDHLDNLKPVVRDMRHAFEHIDERAQGRVNSRGTMDAAALTIFDQPDFIDSSILLYKGARLDFYNDVLNALLTSRGLVMKVIDLRASSPPESS